jgi:hypothetical protein
MIKGLGLMAEIVKHSQPRGFFFSGEGWFSSRVRSCAALAGIIAHILKLLGFIPLRVANFLCSRLGSVSPKVDYEVQPQRLGDIPGQAEGCSLLIISWNTPGLAYLL